MKISWFSRETQSAGLASDAEAVAGIGLERLASRRLRRPVENQKFSWSLDLFFVTFFGIKAKESKTKYFIMNLLYNSFLENTL